MRFAGEWQSVLRRYPQKLVRYYDFDESDTTRAILAFDGPTWEDESDVPRRLEVTVVTRGPHRVHSWQLAWHRQFGSLPVISGPWNGYRLVAVVGDYVLTALGPHLAAFDIETGREAWSTRTGPLPVRRFEIVGQHIVVLTDWLGGSSVVEPSNLCGLNLGGSEVWRASLPDFARDGDVFVPPLGRSGEEHFTVGLFFGYRLTMDATTGELVDAVFTK